MIKIIITKSSKRDEFEQGSEEIKGKLANNPRDYLHHDLDRLDEPRYYKTDKALEVELTEEQFAAVKKAVLEQF